MAIELPGWLEPVLNAYMIPWPDVDEDAFHDMSGPLQNFGRDLGAVGEAIESALQLLQSGNPSQTLQAIGVHFQTVRSDFLDPIGDVCSWLGGTPCDIAYDAIVALKTSAIALLFTEIISNLADLVGTAVTLGLDSAPAIAEAAAVRELIHEMITSAEGQIGSALMSAASNVIDEFVNSLLNPFIQNVEGLVESAVDSYMPTVIVGSGLAADLASASQGTLHVSAVDIMSCATSVVESAHQLEPAAQQLISATEELFSHPAPSPQGGSVSSALRLVLKGVVTDIQQTFISGIRELLQHVTEHFVNLLQNYLRALQQLDEQARALAALQHAGQGAPVVALTAAGLGYGAAETVLAVSAVVDARLTDQVQVAAVAAVSDPDSLLVATTGSAVATNASLTMTEQTPDLEVRPRTELHGIVGVAASAGSVEDLHVRSGGDGPQMAPVTAEGIRHVAGVSSRHDEHGRVGAVDAGATHVSGVQEVHVKDAEAPKQAFQSAHQAGESVQRVEAKKSATPPTVEMAETERERGAD